jgi:hypothetical protein
MLMVVPLAFRRALLAHPRANLEQLAKHRLIVTGPPEAQPRRRLANV